MQPHPSDDIDWSNGYEAAAAEFIRRRDRSSIGVATVRSWTRSLPAGASILDIGCGHGVPISMALANDGFAIHGIDASARLAAEFGTRLPHVPIACEPLQSSRFFDRTFDGVLAVGLMFLLPEDAQLDLVRRVGQLAKPGGSFMFTSPDRACSWTDILTGRESRSLGAKAYEQALVGAGMILVDEREDEGGSHYYIARRAHPSP